MDPTGWNETGNILGFPAAIFAACGILTNKILVQEMEMLAWSHIENAFGRNPTGRQFSYKGPEEVEGVDLGWYSRHKGGIGLLEDVQFVFDGSPKSFHYPNYPEVGDLGWTEGWVQFNTAFNMSMAYIANYYTDIILENKGNGNYTIALTAPLNFDYKQTDVAKIKIVNQAGESLLVSLKEASPLAVKLVGSLQIKENRVVVGEKKLSLDKDDRIILTYGYGYFERRLVLPVSNIEK